MIMYVSRTSRLPNFLHAAFWIIGDPNARFCKAGVDITQANVCKPKIEVNPACECPGAGDPCPPDLGFGLVTT